MKPTVYIETTIPSYYWDERTEIAHDIRRTRQWWDQERDKYEVFVSTTVIDELEDGNYPIRDKCLNLVKGLPLLRTNDDIAEIAEHYERCGLMPRSPVRDSLHLATASYYRMEYLLTWNCRHLANIKKIRHLEVVNQRLGLGIPILLTPAMLQLEE